MTALSDAIARACTAIIDARNHEDPGVAVDYADITALIDAAKRADAWEAVAMGERERCVNALVDQTDLWSADAQRAYDIIFALPAPTLPTGE